MNYRLRALGTSLLLLCIRAFSQEDGPVASQPSDPPRAVAFIVPRPRNVERDEPFARLLADSLQVELARAGLEARVPEASSLPELAGATVDRLLAEAAGADFLVLESYTSTGQTIRLEVAVLRVKDGQRIASSSISRRIDLRLDEAVDTAVEQLLPQLSAHIAEAVRSRQLEAEARLAAAEQAPPAAEAPSPQQAEQQESPSAAAAPPQPEALPATEAVAEPAVEPPAKPERRRERFLEIGVGGGTFFPMAELDQLFRFGYLAEVYLDYRLRRTAAVLALGLYAGYASLLPAETGTATFFESLVPVGLSLSLGTPGRSRLGVHVRVQAGAALNVSPQSKVDERLTRVLPQFRAGAGLSVDITPWLGVSLEFLYELLLYMYMSAGALTVEPIMGFNAPSLFFYTRW